MKNKDNRNTLLLLALLGIVLFIAYPYLNPSEETVEEEARLAVVEEATALLGEIQAISFDFGVLKAPEFDHLEDKTIPLPNLPVGRTNPFAPLR